MQKIYSEALELCLNTQVLTEYTLSERYVMFCNLHPNFTQHMLRSMYGVAPIANGRFDTSKQYSDRQTNKMTEEQFKAWILEVSKSRQEYKSGEISGEELIDRVFEKVEEQI